MPLHPILLLIASASATSPNSPAPATTTVFVVRHAEKGAGDNPSLTESGQGRAASLAQMLRSSALDAVYSTDLCRTAQTVDPAAHARSLPIHLLPVAGADLSTCSPALRQPITMLPQGDDLAARIRALPAGSRVLVAGHSNTTPDLVAALGAPPLCPDVIPLDAAGQCWLDHGAYDSLFVVTLPAEGDASVVRLRYGNPTD